MKRAEKEFLKSIEPSSDKENTEEEKASGEGEGEEGGC